MPKKKPSNPHAFVFPLAFRVAESEVKNDTTVDAAFHLLDLCF
jgi:hypothetical protein